MTEKVAHARKNIRIRLLIRGVVQGVGFRPYVYSLANRHGLNGFVKNGPLGVVVEAEGETEALEIFVAALPAEAPPLVRISEIERDEIVAQQDTQFVIHESDSEGAFTLIPPDICVCEACLKEIRDPADRRYEYPFTNCTNCGPRYSIICDIPYDRQKTTMVEFAMCPACRAEYIDPSSRRFHAQPNACPECGPRMQLAAKDRTSFEDAGTHTILREVARRLNAGGIVAWKGLGGYQLACDAKNADAVRELRRRKRRNEKPFAVMVADVSVAEQICFVSKVERDLLVSPEKPIVLLVRRPEADLADQVSPDNPMTGVMLPCTPMHDLLFRAVQEGHTNDSVLVMTSGNVSEEPIVTDNAAAEEQLGSITDVFVHHNRQIHTRVDDSVVRVVGEAPMLLRRARGYAPRPVWLGLGDAEVLACGAQQKSTLCLTKSGFALPSQHLGDLENYETLQFFEETLERMRRLFHVEPQCVVHDLHPGYLSTQVAKKLDVERHIAVQHHHAHVASCMAEHRLSGSVIGVAWDGTGLGTDGTIWGGEFLVVDLAGFERAAHLRTVLLAGGDAAIREPWRLARSYLRDAFDGEIPEGVRSCDLPEGRIVDAMLEKRIHTMETSSCGRLFDAVAALIGLRQKVSFEGQAAMALEAVAATGHNGHYEFALIGQNPVQVDMRPMIRQIVREMQACPSVAGIAARFHDTLVAVMVEVCGHIRQQSKLSRVCLSGGCFQNARLLSGAVHALQQDGFEVFFQREIPCNDGGISLGQAAIACERIRQGV